MKEQGPFRERAVLAIALAFVLITIAALIVPNPVLVVGLLLAALLLCLLGLGVVVQRAWLQSKKLLAAEAQKQAILETTADGILVANESGVIESANAAAVRILGYAAAELCGQTMRGLLHLEIEEGSGEVQARCKDGHLVRLRLAVCAYRAGSRQNSLVVLHDLTERDRTAEALSQKASLLQALLDNLPDSIYFKDTSSRFIRLNRALAARFGLSDPNLAVGKSDADFFTSDHALQALADEQKMIQTGQPVVGLEEKETWSTDGHTTWALSTKMPLRNKEGQIIGTFGISRDITEQKQVEAEIKKISAYLDSIIDNIPIVLFVKDARELRFERWNKAGEELLGFSREELLGKNDYDFFPKDEADFFIAKDRDVVRSRQRIDIPEEPMDTKRGRRILHTKKIPLFDADGNVTHLVGISEDITERKHAEEELKKAKEAAEAANRAKSEFLANVSHEIRTPMNGIIGMTELALDTELSPEQREYLDMVKASADALLEVINDILDFSKIEAGKLDLDLVDFQLRDSLGDTVKTLALRAHKKGLELVCRVPPGVPDALVGDAGRLRQIIVNLVGNAIKFTEQGEIEVAVGTSACDDSAVLLQFSVRDTGIGIEPHQQAAIFAPFVQADGSITRKYGGTGLGLAISMRLVEMMGGRMWLDSTPGQGSTFHFTARLALQTGSKQVAPASQPAALEGLPVLIVDDNATNRRILVEILSNWHMKPTALESGAAALVELQRAAAAGLPYPLVLLDAMMPQMDGFALAEQIKLRQELAGVTLLMLSSADRQTYAARSKELGITACLMKPVKQSELYDTIRRSLGAAQERQEKRPAASSPTAVHPLRVLLAEDNAVNQKLVVRLLEKQGHQVVVAENGYQALACLQQQAFDLILMDVQMPEMGGFEATAAIRNEEKTTGRRVPIIAMTAHAMKGDRERCLEAGMDGYVSKPVQVRELYEAIGQVVSPGTPRALPPQGEIRNGAVDWTAAVDKLGGDEELLKELAGVFLEEWPRWRADVGHALAGRDAVRLRRLAHTLKGSLGQFEASAAVATAQRLEETGKRGNLDEARDLWLSLEQEIEQLRPVVADFAQRPATTSV
jgi:PAS domain S-box-containing protein